MSTRFVVIIWVCLQCISLTSFSQSDSLLKKTAQPKTKPLSVIVPHRNYRDSTVLSFWQLKRDSIRAVKDSIKALGDSLSMVWIKPPNPRRTNRFVDSIIERHTVKNLDFNAWAKRFNKKVSHYHEGKPLKKGEPWVLGYIVLLMLFFGLLKKSFGKDLWMIVQASYSSRILSQISKEEGIFSSWPFVFLYILFGFTIGMLLYLCGNYFQLTYTYQGFQWVLILSMLIITLFTVKIILLRVLGFIFGIGNMVREYISVLYVCYFNCAILYLPLLFGFSLTTARYSGVFVYIALFIIIAIFGAQFIRIGANIVSNYKFPKIYLIIYLCALEFCPVLILIKALRF